MYTPEDNWKAETVAFFALQSINEVEHKSLYRIAAQGSSFASMFKLSSIEEFYSALELPVPQKLSSCQPGWEQIKKKLWQKGIALARVHAKSDIKIIFYTHSAFPKILKSIPSPPMWLFVQGPIANLHKDSITLVGSRDMTEDGFWMTRLIVASLANTDIVTISGLAKGVDQQVHMDSIRFGLPTVAVLATGINLNYPLGSEHIRQKITENGGTIVSEYFPDQKANRDSFIQRNRIQAGLSNCIIPIEWQLKSGTSHTLNFARKSLRFIAMPYLSDKRKSTELNIINSYQKGEIYCVPNQLNALTAFIEASNTLNID